MQLEEGLRREAATPWVRQGPHDVGRKQPSCHTHSGTGTFPGVPRVEKAAEQSWGEEHREELSGLRKREVTEEGKRRGKGRETPNPTLEKGSR